MKWIATCLLVACLGSRVLGASSAVPAKAPAAPGKTGSILFQMWDDVSGGIGGLTSHEDFPIYPARSSQLNLFEIPADKADGYGSRVLGYVHAPATGNYTFWIASDDQSELWLSTSDNPKDKVKIASVGEWTGPREWTRLPTQQSKPVPLAAGKKYYIEALHAEGSGGDNLAVGWQLPDGKQERPIPGSQLSPFEPPPAPAKAQRPPPPPPDKHGSYRQKFETTREGKPFKMAYSLYLPVGYESSQQKWPMLVFLHGAGECGTDCQMIWNAHGPEAEMRRNPKLKDAVPMVVLSPQCPPGLRYDSPGLSAAVLANIEEVISKYRVDPTRIYATGLSMGGKMTWQVALDKPTRFAAIAPISAIAVDPQNAPAKLKGMAVWIIAGGADGHFTEGSKQMGELLKTGGVDVELTVVPNEGHGVWGRYYPDAKLYEWFLKHKRADAK